VDEIARALSERDLEWRPVFRHSWIQFQRSGGYGVVTVYLRRELPVLLRVKLPRTPGELGLDNPYPDLAERWEERSKEWSWEVPSPNALPEVGIAVDITRRYQPPAGPMSSDQVAT
jgi:hypothetical protein